MYCLRLVMFVGLLGSGCGLDEQRLGPTIESVRPAAARAGTRVTLVGHDFGLPGPRDRVWLAGVEVEILQWADRAIDVVVPEENGPGTFDFVVRTDAQISAPLRFEVLVAPSM